MKEWIDAFAAGADECRRAIAGLTPAELNATPIAGTWSIQQVVLHLLDSDLIAGERMKRVVAEDNPLIVNYDETRFSQRLAYERMDASVAAEIFALHRRHVAQFLRCLPAEAASRSGVHTERGKLTLGDLVRTYAEHLPHHMKFVAEKRRALGKPLS